MHSLEKFVLCDIGLLQDKKEIKSDKLIKKTWAINLVASEKAHSNKKKAIQVISMDNNGIIMKRARPNTSSMYNSIFVGPKSIQRNTHRDYFDEIGWSFTLAAACYQKKHTNTPFYCHIDRPQLKGLAGLYNKLKLGKQKLHDQED